MPTQSEVITEEEMRRRERQNVLAALRRSGGKVYGPEGAAELLGVPPTTLISRMRRMRLKKSTLFE